MRDESPTLRGAFREMGDDPAGPPIDMPFVVVCTILAFGFCVCVAHVLFA